MLLLKVSQNSHKNTLSGHIRKVGPETRYFLCDPRPETRDPKGGSRDPRPGTLMIPGTRDPGPRRWDPGPL